MNLLKSAIIIIHCLSIFLLFACGNEQKDANWTAAEEFPGGDATVDDFSMNAFSHAVPTLTESQELAFVTGNAFFKRNWVTAPASTADLDGLGPLFNAKSCSSCHLFDGRAEPPALSSDEGPGLLFRLSINDYDGVKWKTIDEPTYGGQFNHQSILGIKNEGKVEIEYNEIKGSYPDGTSYTLRKPAYKFTDLNYGSMSDSILVSPRIAPQVIGLGLLEAIDARDLQQLADPNDQNNDGISGKLNYVFNIELDSLSIGRFGWKANEPSVKQQVASAFAGDIGITSEMFPKEACTGKQSDCNTAPNGGQYELSNDILNRVTVYSQSLAVPKRRSFKSDSILSGKALFTEIGCNNCHTPSFITGKHPSIKALSNQKIYPYTDLLLHDMGDDLADGRPDGLASGSEWRTPPLWGIGLIPTVNGHTTLLHDGRARNVEEAILWHGGEAEKSKSAFKHLSSDERKNLIAFVNSL